MERIVIIDHDKHTLHIEDIDEDILEKYYNGEEEEYIKEQYKNILSQNYSWDYITGARYKPMLGERLEIDFDNICGIQPSSSQQKDKV